MVKKVRLLDEAESTNEAPATPVGDNVIDAEKLMKFLEAIDWKLWEMLKLARKQDEANDEK
jgi:hypothetical protein